MSKIRLGIIGCGNMTGNHLDGLFKLSDRMEISAACDVDEEGMMKFAANFDNCFTTVHYEEMVDYVDAVLISLPHDLHYNCGLFFANHKKHILMEKPLCNLEEECLRLIKVCDREDVILMCGYPVPYWPYITKLKELADSGEYGTVFQMSVFTEQLTQFRNDFGWGSSGRLGGGQLFSHGCHYIDLMLWFMGEPVEGVHIGTNKCTPWLIKEGTSNVALKFKSGATGYHFGTWGARGTRMGYDYQLLTDKGTLCLTAGEIRFYQNTTDEHGDYAENGRYEVVWKWDGEKSKNTHFEMIHFLDCIENHTRPLTDGRRAIQSLRLIWRLYDAEKQGVVADLRGLGLDQFNEEDLDRIELYDPSTFIHFGDNEYGENEKRYRNKKN